jgi:hypothetical protein
MKKQAAVVDSEHRMIYLWSQFVYFHAWHQSLGVEVPKLSEEKVIAVVLSMDD